MFEGITTGLKGALSFFNRGKLTEHNMQEGLQAVQQALLEADVSYQVAVDFTKRVAEQAAGTKILESLNPAQQIVGIVHQELTNLMGPEDSQLNLRRGDITIILMCGLQGSGKTTTCGKLANLLKSQGRRAMMVAADLQRPAAIEQLKIIGQQLNLPVYTDDPRLGAVAVCKRGLEAAKKSGDVQVLIVDTAGRLHVDQDLMREIEQIDRAINPHEVLLVCDAMTGQDAVNSAKAFNDALELNGIILTKLDGDARGGAALSVKSITGVPIKFIGVGEQLDRLETFHPDRMAGRILDMGDVLSLFEKAQREFDAEEMAKAQEKMLKGRFTLNDFLTQMQQIKRLGPLGDVMKMIPGLSGLAGQMPSMGEDAEGELTRIEGMIRSMTKKERENPDIIDQSRRRRIAAGSGVDAPDVHALLKQFGMMQNMMQSMAGMSNPISRMRAVNQMAAQMAANPQAAMMAPPKIVPRKSADLLRAEQDKKKKARKDAAKQRKKNRR